MSNDNASPYALLTKRYLNGRIPFRVWIFSSLVAAMAMIVFNLVQHNAVLEGFFSLFFLNLAVTIPVFVAQAHFVGLELQRNPEKAKKILTIVLAISWTVTAIFIAWILSMIYEGGWNAGASLMTVNCVIQLAAWWCFSFLLFRVKEEEA